MIQIFWPWLQYETNFSSWCVYTNLPKTKFQNTYPYYVMPSHNFSLTIKTKYVNCRPTNTHNSIWKTLQQYNQMTSSTDINKVTSALSKSMLPQILLFLRGYRVGDILNVPKYFKLINLVGVIDTYTGKTIKDNSTEFYTYLLNNHVT